MPRRSRIDRELEQGIELFRKFREADPEFYTRLDVRVPIVAMMVGELESLIYRTTHADVVHRYQHKFSRRAAPLLAASADGRQLLILDGNYNFTEDGIVDLD